MSLGRASPPPAPGAPRIEVAEPEAADCTRPPPPEGNVKLRNYRTLNDHLRAYTPTGDVNTSPTKGKLMPRYDVCSDISPPRARILELLRPEDPGREALEAIVRPAARRGLARPLDDDSRRFLERALLSPSPQGLSAANTPEPDNQETSETVFEIPQVTSTPKSEDSGKVRSLADELREAEEDERTGNVKRDRFRELYKGGVKEAVERERLGRLALSVEEDEGGEERAGLGAAARRLDALLAESRQLQRALSGIHDDLQAQSLRACRCAEAARALGAESCALRYLDDVVALLRGDVDGARRAKAWPFALGHKQPGRNYVI